LIVVKDEEMMELKRPIIEACIKTSQKNGWSTSMGILWGTLFLESEPMSMDMLAEKTGYSKTTVRANMNYMENIGMAQRVVGPLGKQHRDKQHRFALVTDIEAVRLVVLSTVKEEVNLILQALLQVKKNIEDQNLSEAELKDSLAEEIQIYENLSRILNLLSEFTPEEIIEILERKKKSKSSYGVHQENQALEEG
jgi:DNA-binding transcriptional regulator GbsR (MarR family)